MLTGSQEAHQRARKLRRNMTKPERLLWWALRADKTGWHFRRQHAAGPYILDFYCAAAKLCVEVDGFQHDQQGKSDFTRDRFLADQGVRTLRFSSREVLWNLTGVVQAISFALLTPPSACG